MEDGTLKKLELYLHDLHKKIDGIYDMLMLRHKGKYVPYVPQHTMAAMADYRLTDWLTLGANVNAQGIRT